jgi:HEAT repeat protein
MRMWLLATVLFSIFSFADTAGRNAEAQSAVESIIEGDAPLNQALNRIRFAGAERYASLQCTIALRKILEGRRRSRILEALAQVATSDHAETEETLRRAATDGDIGDRLNAIRGLEHARSRNSIPLLEKLCLDKLVGIRTAAARALGELGDPRTAKTLISAAKVEPEPSARIEQLRAVGKTKAKSAKGSLLSFLKSDSESTRLSATAALCRLGAAEGKAEAKRLLTDKDNAMRLTAVMLFEGFSAKEAGPMLTGMLSDSDVRVRATAARILAQGGDGKATAWLLTQSTAASAQDKGILEAEIEKLNLADTQRAAILKNPAP